MSLSKLTKALTKSCKTLSFEEFTREPKTTRNPTFVSYMMTLWDFLSYYREDIMEAYDVCIDDDLRKEDFLQIYCIVDISRSKKITLSAKMRNRYRKAGKERREKLKNKYHYANPFNRIHAYAIIEHSPGGSPDESIAIDVVCTSNYSDQKGMGSYLMKQIIGSATRVGYKNIVLEVGNDDAAKDEESDCESEESDESDCESEESDCESEEEEEEDYEDLIDVVAKNLWKKSVRHRDGDPYYSIGGGYIRCKVSQYVYDEELETEPVVILEDEEYGYGGYYYSLGKRNNIALYNYYEKLGFKEDPKVHKEWKCFGDTAFPSMIMKL